MAKASQKSRKSPKRLDPSRFTIEKPTAKDCNRYISARSRVVYSYHVIKDKNNISQIQQMEKANSETQKLARKLAETPENEFSKLMAYNVQIFFFVRDSIDCGFSTVVLEDKNTAYIGGLTVFNHLHGMGTLFYNMLEAHLKNLGVTKITLKAPFNGCKPFWPKMGFTPETDNSIVYEKFL